MTKRKQLIEIMDASPILYDVPSTEAGRFIVDKYPKQFSDPRRVASEIRSMRSCGMIRKQKSAHINGEYDLSRSGITGLTEKISKYIKDKPASVEQLANKFDVSPLRIRNALELLKGQSFNVSISDDQASISTSFSSGGVSNLDPKQWNGNRLRFGLVSDAHLCNKFSREDVLNMLYDRFEQEGITTVYNGGNWIDGEKSFNKNDLIVHGLTRQIEYAVKHYPYRKDIKTYFITADDHEGWYSQESGIDIGKLFQSERESAGMNDLVYLGYSEADIDLNAGEFKKKQVLRIVHPGGGSAYAVSYRPQKIVESYQGGEKPAMLAVGHYHKSGYNFFRNVHTILIPCTEDQTVFMRKKSIEAHVGGVIVDVSRDDRGIITSVKTEFIMAFNKAFYEKSKYYFQ